MMPFVLHIDIDAFFPSIEKKLKPELKNVPLAIGKNKKRAVISSACYIARQYGVHAGMPNFKAKVLCPNLVFSFSPMETYLSSSRKFMHLLKHNVDGKVLIGSIDEAYIELNSKIKNHSKAYAEARKIQLMVKENLDLEVSIGISNNKFLAKMSTKFAKPKGIFWIYPDEVKSKLWNLPIKEFFGIGKTKFDALKRLHIETIGDFASRDINDPELEKLFGSFYKEFHSQANGSNKYVSFIPRIKTKSLGASKTFLSQDLESTTQILNLLKKLTFQSWRKMIDENKKCLVIAVQIKTSIDFTPNSHQVTLKKATNSFEKIYKIVTNQFLEHWNQKPLRYVGMQLRRLQKNWDATKREIDEIKAVIIKVNRQQKAGSVFVASDLLKYNENKL